MGRKLFKRREKETLDKIKEVLVLKDLKEDDTVFFTIRSGLSHIQIKQLRDVIVETLRCNVIFLSEEVGLETIEVKDSREDH